MGKEKDIIFFSHSSADSALLSRIKKLILEKTSNSVSIFLSSDGQSIKLGRNWVSSIEEKLKDASVMFVFVTPQSINSKWIYFEAGFAYSKEIDVIPIGIYGVDLNDLTPPLSLLQGFNISNADGLNNIIAKINELSKTTFPLSISDKDYENLRSGGFQSNELLGTYMGYVDALEISFQLEAKLDRKGKDQHWPAWHELAADALTRDQIYAFHKESADYIRDLLIDVFDQKRLKYHMNRSMKKPGHDLAPVEVYKFHLNGMVIELPFEGERRRPDSFLVKFTLDTALSDINFEIVDHIATFVEEKKDVQVAIRMRDSVSSENNWVKFTSLLRSSDLDISGEWLLTYQEYDFTFTAYGPPVMTVIDDHDMMSIIPLQDILAELFNCGALVEN